MNRFVVCFRNTITNQIFVEPKVDFKEIRFLHGFDNYEVLDEKFYSSKRTEISFTKKCFEKYK